MDIKARRRKNRLHWKKLLVACLIILIVSLGMIQLSGMARKNATSTTTTGPTVVGRDDHGSVGGTTVGKVPIGDSSSPWANVYNLPGSIYSLEQTPDGGYIVAGATRALGIADQQVLFGLRLDAKGGIVWQKYYNDTMIGSPDVNMQQTSDNGYVLGTISSLLKIDSNGNPVWRINYDAPQSWGPVLLAKTLDNGYVLARTLSVPGYNFPISLLRLDSTGSILWSKFFQDPSVTFTIAQSIQQTSDGGFMLGGIYSRDNKALLVKLDANGKIMWQKAYTVHGLNTQIDSVLQTSDDGYIVSGGGLSRNLWTFKTDKYGSIQWAREFTNGHSDPPYHAMGSAGIGSVSTTRDGGYVLAGEISSNQTAVIKLTSDGNLSWGQVLRAVDRYSAREIAAIHETLDGGFVIGGTAPFQDIPVPWLAKLDASGQCCNNLFSNMTVSEVSTGTQEQNVTIDSGSMIVVPTEAATASVSTLAVIAPICPETHHSTVVSGPQSKWVKSYNVSSGASISSIQEISDGSYIAAGVAYGQDRSGSLWIFQVDKYGNILWQNTYPAKIGLAMGMVQDSSLHIAQTGDGGFIIVGSVSVGSSWPRTMQKALIIKIDSQGSLEWNETYGSGMANGLDQAVAVQQAVDNGFVIVGTRNDSSWTTPGQSWIIKLDMNGQLVWQKQYAAVTGSDVQLYSISLTTSHEYLVAGSTSLTLSSYWQFSPLILRLDQDGNIVWQDSLAGGYYGAAYNVIEASQGQYVLVGHVLNSAMVVKLNSQGEILWQYGFGWDVAPTFYSISKGLDGGFIIGGGYGGMQHFSVMLKINSTGGAEWEKELGLEYGQVTGSSDGGYVAVGGYPWAASQEGYHPLGTGWIMKFDSQGHCCNYKPNQFNDLVSNFTSTPVRTMMHLDQANVQSSNLNGSTNSLSVTAAISNARVLVGCETPAITK